MFIDAMSGYAKAAIAAIVLVALAGTHWKAYTVGRGLEAANHANQIREQADQIRDQAEALAKQSAEYRDREQVLIQEKHNAEVRYEQIRKRTRTADAGMRDELGRLRDELAAASLPRPTGDSTTGTGADGSAITGDLFGDCAARYSGLAEETGRLRDQVTGLQDYVSSVCQKFNGSAIE